jgi:hypothetical protein
MATNNSYDSLFDASGKQYNVDPRLLKTIFTIESSGNPNTPDSYQGAQGGMQIMPQTAKALGVTNPHDMTQAIPAAAQYVRQGLDATGSPEGALQYYHGGPDQRNWGPKTEAYRRKGALAYQNTTINPNAAPAPASSSSSDDSSEEDVVDSIIKGVKSKSQSPAISASAAPADDPNDVVEGILRAAKAKQATATSAQPDTTPAPQVASQAQPDAVQSFAAGVGRGVRDVGDVAAPYLSGAVKYLSDNPVSNYLDSRFPALGKLDQTYSQTDPALAAQAKADYEAKFGNSLAAGLGRFAGQTATTLPVGGAIGAAGKGIAAAQSGNLLSGLVRLGTGAAQGGAAAAMTGGDIRQGALAGGAVGGLGGAASGLANSMQNGGTIGSILNSKIADKIVHALSAGAGYHFGDIGGLLAGQAIGPVIKEITLKYGPKVAAAAAKALSAGNASGVLPGAAGIGAGQADTTPLTDLLNQPR